MLFKAIFTLVTAIVVLPILNVVLRMRVEDNHHKHHPGNCRKIKSMGIGSEDIQITSSGLAFVTSGLTFQAGSNNFITHVKSKGWGRIQLLDLNALHSSLEAKELKIKHGKDFNRAMFRPHGLSVLEDKIRNEHLIYVVNHGEDGADSVEKFRYLPETKVLEHVKSFYSDLFRITNDLAVAEEDNFYISNCLYSKNPILATIEQVYELSLGSVLFHNGSGATQVVGKGDGPNGVTLSKDGRYLYVAFLNAETVRVYERHSDLDIRQVQEVKVHTQLDNFHISDDGHTLYGGSHPNAGKLAWHMMNPEHKAPSQVLRIPLKDGLIVEKEITQEFYDDGDLISGSSIAGVYKDQMVVGSVIDSLVVCQLSASCSLETII